MIDIRGDSVGSLPHRSQQCHIELTRAQFIHRPFRGQSVKQFTRCLPFRKELLVTSVHPKTESSPWSLTTKVSCTTQELNPGLHDLQSNAAKHMRNNKLSHFSLIDLNTFYILTGDYESNQCEDSGCVPCRQRYGTCIGYPDGPNQWEDKPWTPYFVICKDQRVILQGDCRKSGKVNIFNPVTRTCMPMSDLIKMAESINFI